MMEHTPQRDPLAREKIHKLLRLQLGRDIGYDEFRVQFEELFNFGLSRSEVPAREFELLQRLFDTVILYSPFEHDRERYKGFYRDEKQVATVVEEVRQGLGIGTSSQEGHD